MSSVLLIEYNDPARKNVYICGELRLKPGINEVHKSIWEAVKSNPGVKSRVADEYIKMFGEKGESKQKKSGKKEEESGTTLENISVAKARKIVSDCFDVETLLKWKGEEETGKKRKGLIDAIEKQLYTIDEAANEEDDGGGEDGGEE
jgi:hypothetical protein